MLTELSIRNFAIIDDLSIRFSNGLTILSGETGAVKSIIINAVNLLLGSRATTTLIRNGAQTAEIEAHFQISAGSRAAEAMQTQGLDISEGLLARRIISRNDRHRIYINGRLSTIQTLKEITQHMASISGQRAHQGLLKEERQLYILDLYGGLLRLRQQVFESYHQVVAQLKRLKKLKGLEKRRTDQVELLLFQKQEILAAKVVPGEDLALEQEAARLKHADKLYRAVYGSLETLYGAEGAVVEQLSGVKRGLEKVSAIDSALMKPLENINDTVFRVEDIVQELREYLQHIQMDDKRLAEVEDRLDFLNGLKRKYGNSLEMIVERAVQIQKELDNIEGLSERIAGAKKDLEKIHDKTARLSKRLSKERRRAADSVGVKVEKELATLRMAGTTFEIGLTSAKADGNIDPHLQFEGRMMTETGFDHVSFLIAPNIGESMKALSEIASGGELSRVVLALKAILVQKDSVETVVFDEVDAGIGGGVAEAVGKKLSALSAHHQVVCITHLPQIAKFGQTHYRISKEIDSGRTATVIKRLNDADRIQEIARMLGGEEITPQTLSHARELLQTLPS